VILGIGVDITQISRFKKWENNDRIIERFFHKKESKKDAEFLASRFAAKEALSKALGTGLRNLSLNEICISLDEKGKPFFEFFGKTKTVISAFNAKNVHLSLSHDGDSAIAFVILEG
jgi:holo-[acyl-carrier protein] synthase